MAWVLGQRARSGFAPHAERGGAGSVRWRWRSLLGASAFVVLWICLLAPVPSTVVDILLAISVALSMVLVVASVRVERASQLRWFPTLVLSATLFRLCINVSTTRLILTDGYAGRVVDAFGGVVVRGDLVVGAVIFAIITGVQFMVITRGASRMAEVSARFALDALPGHQAAIRDEVAAKTLSAIQAARRRQKMLERADFYGAMDGTARFVRGDAVVGVLIVCVNLGGGMWMGMVRNGMGFNESLARYGTLTIGDGLLAQIPALLVSLAAALLVARVEDRGEARAPLRLPRDPLVFAAPAAALGALALWDQMPTLAFASVAIALVGIALVVATRGGAVVDAAPDTRGLELWVATDTVAPTQSALAAYRARLLRQYGVDPGPVRVQRTESTGAALTVRVGGRMLGTATALPEASPSALLRAADKIVAARAETLLSFETAQDWIVEGRRAYGPVAELAFQGMDVVRLRGLLALYPRSGLSVPPMHEWLPALAEGAGFDAGLTLDAARERLRLRTARWWFAQLREQRPQGWRRWRLTPDFECALEDAIHVDEAGALRWSCSDAAREEITRGLLRAAQEHDALPSLFIASAAARGRAEWVLSSVGGGDAVSGVELDQVDPAWREDTAVRWLDLHVD